MVEERIRTVPSPLRCPYCHEQVALERDDWLACAGCLARHHGACWGEAGRCAACDGTATLTRRDAERALAHGEPAVDEQGDVPLDEERASELRRLIRAHERSNTRSVLDYVFAPLTLMAAAPIAAELRLLRHLRDNADELDPGGLRGDADTRRYRREALDDARRGARRRVASAVGAFLVASGLALTGTVILTTLALGDGDSHDAFAAMISLAIGLWLVTQWTLLTLHWRAVRNHEARQLYLGLLDRGVEEEQAKRLLAEHAAAWQQAGFKTAVGTLLAHLLPFPTFPIGLPFWLAYAFKSQLTLHEEREATTSELHPRRRPRKPGATAEAGPGAP